MEFFDVIKNRGSYRGEFEKADIPQEDLRRILDAGIRAPSSYNLQTTTFYAVTNETLRHALSDESGKNRACHYCGYLEMRSWRRS